MKSSSKLIVLLGKTHLQAAQISFGNKITRLEILDETWTPDNLAEIFVHLRETTSLDKAEILIGEGLYLITSIRLSNKQKHTTIDLEAEANKALNRQIEFLGIDYKLLKTTSKDQVYQLFVVKKELLSLIGKAAKQASLHISSVHSLAHLYGLSHFTQKDTASLLLWEDDKFNLALGIDHQVYVHRRFDFEDVYKQIESLISLGLDQFGINVSRMIMAKQVKSIDSKKIVPKKLKLESVELDPFADNEIFSFDDELAQPPEEVFAEEDETLDKSHKSEDEKQEKSSIMDTNISAPEPPLKHKEKVTDMDSSVSQPPNRSNAKVLIMIVTIVVVLIGLIVGGLLVYRNALSQENQSPQIIKSDNQATPEPVVSPSPESTVSAEPESETTTKIADYSVEILNGSGVPGEAGKAADLLKADGFEEIKTGNADSYDYTQTEVSVKSNNKGLYDLIEKSLSSSYTVVAGDELNSDSGYDAVIIVGKE